MFRFLLMRFYNLVVGFVANRRWSATRISPGRSEMGKMIR